MTTIEGAELKAANERAANAIRALVATQNEARQVKTENEELRAYAILLEEAIATPPDTALSTLPSLRAIRLEKARRARPACLGEPRK